MRAKAWWVLAVVAGCGEMFPEDDGTSPPEDSLGTLRQAEDVGDAVEWVRYARGADLQLGSAVTQDRDGNVLTTVLFSGGADLGTGPLGSGDAEVPGVVLAKHSPAGRLLWTRVLQGRKGGLLSVSALGTDRERNVLLAGWSEPGAKLASGAGSEAAPVGVDGAFLMKLGPDGRTLWVKSLEGHGAFLANAVVADRAGNVFVAGSLYDGSLDFGGRVLTATGLRAFVAKYGADGALRWVRGFPSTAALALDVSVSRTGEGVLVGAFGGPTDFGGGTVAPEGGYDAFILRLGK